MATAVPTLNSPQLVYLTILCLRFNTLPCLLVVVRVSCSVCWRGREESGWNMAKALITCSLCLCQVAMAWTLTVWPKAGSAPVARPTPWLRCQHTFSSYTLHASETFITLFFFMVAFCIFFWFVLLYSINMNIFLKLFILKTSLGIFF